jgi:hypothetical protein
VSGDLAQAILDSAKRLGVSPTDLATAVSYETAGTFDPWKRGPTTQWGQHRGLIQWGEPQRQKYGVYKGMSNAAQMQAAERYLKDAGVKSGMGMLDIYSAINAGGVGRYNRSDANNGGAPGTVRDKVTQQMSGHRRNAERLLGSPATSQIAAGPSITSPEPMAQQFAPMQAPGQPFGDLIAPNATQTVAIPPQPQFGDFLLAMQARQKQKAEEQAAEQTRLAALFGENMFGPFG